MENFIASRKEGFSIHVCCGSSPLGDLRIDKYLDNVDIKADMLQLPIKTGVADTVICDPPWKTDGKVRATLSYELRRVLRLGGKLIFNALWFPLVPGLTLEEAYFRPDYSRFAQCSLLFIMRKTRASIFNDR